MAPCFCVHGVEFSIEQKPASMVRAHSCWLGMAIGSKKAPAPKATSVIRSRQAPNVLEEDEHGPSCRCAAIYGPEPRHRIGYAGRLEARRRRYDGDMGAGFRAK